ncbi:carbon storage regulator CsrA [Paenibacillus alvei]|uniref:carbon storage regulator CsrA n=1 Tax=Paenibacillus alvei TaxID=44250 RepID=UPI0018CCD4A0|nr:carbon storage regulator CsrA [Paenibacillus alvei]MBG9735065.1 carbon storage regulator [Paenibacillus alvei]MBG9743523.1 carbon storage regulator [Paenibacillus alvei]MCY9579912.1 carbon storage regulator CsrA [Paenibacillus alvei]MCY9584089.1 carbon storage regulator CsrA [Paenibacillus alvei]
MLVLTRAKGQKIMIGQDIVLTVVEVNGDQVRLGIDAPSDISVYREEIFQSIKEQNEIAAKSDLSKAQLEVLKMMLKKKS